MASTPTFDGELFGRLQSLLMSANDLSSVLTDLADLSTTALDAPVSCGITVRYDGNVLTVGSSDARAELLDETQYHSNDGPCLQSLRTRLIVDCPDARAEQRWSHYITTAVEIGLRCSLSFPLIVGTSPLGALNLYGFERPNLFDENDRRQLELFAAQAAGTLRVATRQIRDTTLMRQMEEALTSRTVIDQAMGIIMGQQRCTASAAFELMRRESQNNRRRLRDVAADLISRTTDRAPQAGRSFDS